MKLIAHQGASPNCPPNTLKAFKAASKTPVDMIEYDVISHQGELIVAHHHRSIKPYSPTLKETLELLASPDFSHLEFNLDLKVSGQEKEIAKILKSYQLEDRTIISSTSKLSLTKLRYQDEELRLALSIGKLSGLFPKTPYFEKMLTTCQTYWRYTLPAQIHNLLNETPYYALMTQWRFITEPLIQAATTEGAQIFAWTIDDLKLVQKLKDLGVSGITTNRPHLLQAAL